MTKMIKLDIGYDPDIPAQWQNSVYEQNKHYEDEYNQPQPMFPYKNGGVKVLGILFEREHITTKGFDPYSGDRWTAKFIGFNVELNSLYCLVAELRYGRRKTLLRGAWSEWKQIPFLLKKVWGYLENSYAWYENHTPDHDEYGSLGDFE